jgi:hypothetical protein
MSPVKSAVLLLLVLLCVESESRATNTFFLPGDAFFHTGLGIERLDRLEEETSPVFGYVRPRNAAWTGCGYAGFASLKYEEMPGSLKKNLVRTGRHIRRWDSQAVFVREVDPETGEESTRELNPMHLFIYNPEFGGRIGLKFNEHWMQHTARYESFVTDHRLVAEDWKLSRHVAPLSIETPFELVGGKKPGGGVGPGFGWGGLESPIEPMGGPRIEEPVTIRGAMKLIVIPRSESTVAAKVDRELDRVALEKDGAVMYVVTVEGVTGRRVVRNEWVDFDPFKLDHEALRDGNKE